MASRVYWYAESLAQTSTSTTDFSVVKISQSFTPNANKTYVLLWNLIGGNNTQYWNSHARLRNTTAGVTLGNSSRQPLDSGTLHLVNLGGAAIYTAPASPASQTIQIQVATDSPATASFYEASLLILELISGVDSFASSTGETSSTSSTYAAKTTLSFTPGSTGNYLCILCGEVFSGANNSKARININSGSSIVSEFNPVGCPDGDWLPYIAAHRLISASGAQSVALDFAGATTSLVKIRNAYAAALRTDQFDSVLWAEDRTAHTSTSATYADSSCSITATPAAVEHALVAVGMAKNSVSYTSGTGQRAMAAGSSVGSVFIQDTGLANECFPWFSLRKRTEAATSTTWKTQYNRAFGSGTATSDEHVLAVLQLAAAFTTETESVSLDSAIKKAVVLATDCDASAVLLGTIITDQLPSTPVVADTTPTSVGTQFFSDTFGHVRYIRWYNGRPLGVRTHKVGLYTEGGSALAEVEVTAEIGPGWQVTELPFPIEIDPANKYVAVVHWPEGQYPKTDAALTAQVDNEELHAYAAGGVKATDVPVMTFPEEPG